MSALNIGPDPNNIQHIVREKFVSCIKDIQPPEWRVIILDPHARELIFNVLKKDDILDLKCADLLDLEKPREQKDFEAVYIISSTEWAIDCICNDFARMPLYKAAHVFVTAAISDMLVDKLGGSLGQRIRGLKEIYLDFFPLEHKLISLKSPQNFQMLFNPSCRPIAPKALDDLASRMVSVCATLNEYPVIRYHVPESTNAASKNSEKLAKMISNGLDDWYRENQDLSLDNSRPRALMFVLDRSIDLFAPLLHEFTYQAMAIDLMDLGKDRNNYSYQTHDGEPFTATLDDVDDIWVAHRHSHIAEVMTKICAEFNKFVADHPNFAKTTNANSLDDIRDMLVEGPQYRDMKDRFSTHTRMVEECMKIFETQKLGELSKVEQDCSTGLTSDGKRPRSALEEIAPLLDGEDVKSSDRLRLLLIYILYKGGITESDREKLIRHANLRKSDADVIRNLALLGAKVEKKFKEPSGKKIKKPAKQTEADQTYEWSRYIPALKTIIKDHFAGVLDHNQYPYTKDQPIDASAQEKESLRTKRPNWANPRAQAARQRVFVVIAGGSTYSEARTCYELSSELRKDIILATDDLLTPASFIQNLRKARDDRDTLQLAYDTQPRPIPRHIEPAPPPQPQPQPQRNPSIQSHHSGHSQMSGYGGQYQHSQPHQYTPTHPPPPKTFTPFNAPASNSHGLSNSNYGGNGLTGSMDNLSINGNHQYDPKKKSKLGRLFK